jgi:HD-GYP domain-containing protein (c-di-GMP phosphodiesterase class II)
LTTGSPIKTKKKGMTQAQKRFLLEQGKNLVYQLYVSIRTSHIYDRSNSVYVRQAESLFSLMGSLLEKTEELYLKSKEGYLFLNDIRLKFSFDGYVSSKFIMDIFSKLHFEGLIINPGLTARELDDFIFVLSHADLEAKDPFESLQEKILSSDVHNIRVEKFASDWDLGDESLPENQKKLAKKRFFKTISVAQETMESVKSGRSINTVKSKRAIQFLIDQLIDSDATLMSLTAIKNFDEYTFAHSVNVCILSVSLGARLGLPKKKLSELGFAALFHDVGKVRLPLEILNKPGELNEEEWEEVRKHPVYGVKTLLAKRNLDRFSARAMVVSFEHHLKMDLSGYPKLSAKKDLSLFTRIVTIADVYDSMTSGRVYARVPLMPDVALQRMLAEQGKFYDSVLLKVFINMLGVYPVGSLVVLDTGEVGVVMKVNPAELSRPEIAIIADRNGKKDKIDTADLTDLDEQIGNYKRSILKTFDPRKYDLDIARYIY